MTEHFLIFFSMILIFLFKTRGNVVSRATARKHQQDVTVEMGNQTLLEDARLPSVKSNVSRGIQRLIRVVKLVVVIAAVNVPLYMMLLFKDWIER